MITIALLDRLDARFDAILMNGAAGVNYWPIRKWIDRKRDETGLRPQGGCTKNCEGQRAASVSACVSRLACPARSSRRWTRVASWRT